MKYYTVRVGLDSQLNQPELLDCLRSLGAEVIQTSDGVVFKTDKDIHQWQSANGKLADIHIHEIDIGNQELNQSYSKDVLNFISA
jgi:hypothetical protein